MTPRSIVPALGAGLLLAAAGCGPETALDQLRGDVLFYAWPHGASLTDQPERVAEARERMVRSLQEIEDFTGTLEAWRQRTGPVTRLEIGPEQFVLDRTIFFYFVGSLRRPATSRQLKVRITRHGPDDYEDVDHEERQTGRVNRRVHASGLLFSMGGLPGGEHRLTLELLDGSTVVAAGDLSLRYDPGRSSENNEGATPAPVISR